MLGCIPCDTRSLLSTILQVSVLVLQYRKGGKVGLSVRARTDTQIFAEGSFKRALFDGLA